MAKKKEFKAGLYGILAGVIVAVVLVGLTIFAFTSRYTAFSPEKTAQTYVDGIVQTGDGYNALKTTLVSKNQKFGDFVINAYMRPYVNDGKDVKKNDQIGTGSAEETQMLDKIYSDMYGVYCELIANVGLDDYNTFYNTYFTKLKEERKAVLGDDYMDTEFMFGVFESNVATYGESLTGTEEQLAQDKKTVLKEASTGKYQELYGKDYKLTAEVSSSTDVNVDEYVAQYKERIALIANYGEEKASIYGITDVDDKHKFKSNMVDAFAKLDCSDSITQAKDVAVEVKNQNGDIVATVNVSVVKIGNSWYVDNTNTDTSSLYIVK